MTSISISYSWIETLQNGLYHEFKDTVKTKKSMCIQKIMNIQTEFKKEMKNVYS